MRKHLLASGLFLAVVPAFAAFTPYYGPDALTTINTANWNQNGSVTATSSGLTSSSSQGGSLISKITPIGPSTWQYEVDVTLALAATGGTFEIYLDAGPTAWISPVGSPSTYYVYVLTPTFNGTACSATLAASKSISGTITSLGSTSVPCHNGMVIRAVRTSHSQICLYIDGAPYSNITDSSISSGMPGIGVQNTASGNAISSVSFYPVDTVAPTAVNAQNVGTSVFPTRVDIQWQGVTDDANGSGLAYYAIYRGATFLANVNKPEFSDETTVASTAYTYNIKPTDYHQNQATTSINITTPPASAIDPRRVGVRPTGSYWGGAGEQVDTLSGNLNYSTQLFKALGRGGTGVGVTLSYNSQLWRQDPGGTWKLDDDVGYGLGWRLQVGALVPFYKGYLQLDHFTFIDSTGAEYRLDQNNNGIWTSLQSAYITYDSTVTPGILHFNDGSFWTMGATSAGTEQDAGTMYPTVIEDSNGNQVLLYYNTGLGVTFANSSARINYIEDVRAIPNPTTRQTYVFTYNADPLPHLSSISNVLGNGSESYTLSYFENQPLSSPFTPATSYGTTTMLQSVAVTTLGLTTSFTYDTVTNSGEITSMTTPYGGKIRWAYGPFTYNGSRTLREVQNRYLTIGTTYSETGAYVFTRPSGDSNLTLHSGLTIDDPSGIGEKAWTFATTGDAALLGTVTRYEDRPSSSQASSPLQRKDFTWTKDILGNPYIGTVLTTLDPTSANMQSQTTQILDTSGNVLTSNIYDYPSLTTPARTYTNTYITDSHWTAYYINNRLLTSTVQNASTPAITLVTNTYDPFPSAVSPTMNEHDSFYNNTNFQYRGNVFTSQRAGGPVVTTYYDVGGNPTSNTDGTTTTSISTTSTTNYAAPSTITPNSNANLQTSASYTSWLSMSSVTGPDSATASTVYDIYGRPHTSTSIYGAGTTYSYSSTLPYVITATTNNTNGTNHWTQTTLDGFGRAVQVLRGTGSTTISEVDTTYAPCACSPTGKVQKVSMPYAPGGTPVYTSYTYDGLGRTVSVLLPDANSTTTYAYSGNATTITDPAGKWKKQTTDAMGNLIQVNEPNPAGGADYITQYNYDLLNHLTLVTMPRPTGTETRTFVYDSNQRLQSETHPESGTKTYTYNTDGTLASRTDAKGITTKYTYDSYKRLTMKAYGQIVNGVFTEDTTQRLTLTYDTNPLNGTYSQNAQGRLTTAQWNYPTAGACGAETGPSYYMYSYTTAGQVAGKTLDITRNTAACHSTSWQHLDFVGTFTYDNEGHMLTMKYPSYSKLQNNQVILQPQLTDTYTYDGMGRQYSLLNSVLNVTRPASATYGPSDEFLTAFDSNGFIIEQHTYNSMLQATNVNSAQYNYPATGNNGQMSSRVDRAGQTVSFAYDSLKRLIAVSGNGVGVPTGGAWSETYSYDGFGNLLAKTPTSGTAPTLSVNVNLKNQITTQGYDANGNMTGVNYDYENRITSAGDMYSYGPDNLRIWKVRSDGSQDVYFYDTAGRKLAVYQVSKVTGGQYYIGGSTMIPPEQQPQWFAGIVLARDGLGSGGANAYYPYGEDYPNWAPVTDSDNFATYYRDVTTGYDYAKNRYYSPSLGRFLTPDPYRSGRLANPGTWNRYVYTLGDPVNNNDPSGLCVIDGQQYPDGQPPCPDVTSQTVSGGTLDPLDMYLLLKGQMGGLSANPGSNVNSINPTQLPVSNWGFMDDAYKTASTALKNSKCKDLFGNPTAWKNGFDPQTILKTLANGGGSVPSTTPNLKAYVSLGFTILPFAALTVASTDVSWQGASLTVNVLISTITIPGSNAWNNGDSFINGLTLLHELGHVFDMLSPAGSGGSQLTTPDLLYGNEQNDATVIKDCFTVSGKGGS